MRQRPPRAGHQRGNGSVLALLATRNFAFQCRLLGEQFYPCLLGTPRFISRTAPRRFGLDTLCGGALGLALDLDARFDFGATPRFSFGAGLCRGGKLQFGPHAGFGRGRGIGFALQPDALGLQCLFLYAQQFCGLLFGLCVHLDTNARGICGGALGNQSVLGSDDRLAFALNAIGLAPDERACRIGAFAFGPRTDFQACAFAPSWMVAAISCISFVPVSRRSTFCAR